MSTAEIIAIIAGAAALGAVLQPLSARFGIPHRALLMLTGFLGSELLVAAGVDTGLRWYHFDEIVLYLVVPVLVFEGALSINFRAARPWLPFVLLLAVPGMLLTAILTGLGLFVMVGHPVGFPLAVAMLAGIIVAATDPGAITGAIRGAVPGRDVVTWLEGESLFSDAAAIVLYTLILGLAVASEPPPPASDVALRFSFVLAGGLAAGVTAGIMWRYFDAFISREDVSAVLSVAIVYGVHSVCQSFLDVSGVLAVLAFALIARRDDRDLAPGVLNTWRIFGFFAETAVFIVAGATVTWALFRDQWLAMLIGIVAATSVRFVMVALLVPVWNAASDPQRRISATQGLCLAGGCGRGAVALALALSLPLELEGWYTVQAVVYGVVMFFLFLQAPLFSRLLARRLGNAN